MHSNSIGQSSGGTIGREMRELVDDLVDNSDCSPVSSISKKSLDK